MLRMEVKRPYSRCLLLGSWGGGISVHYGAFIVFYSRNIDIETDLGVWCVLFGRRHSVGGSSRCSRRLRRARRGQERRGE
jgi:hypothetical protein